MRTVLLSWATLHFILIALPIRSATPCLHAEEIHIKVLTSHNGKPVTNECVNVWIGLVHGASLVAPTNEEGVVVLHFENDQVTAQAVSSRTCKRVADVGPKAVPKDADVIRVLGDEYVACQEYGKIIPGQPVTPNWWERTIPSYPIKRILESGVTAGNTCGTFKAPAKAGELIFFVRPRTFFERMKL